MCRVRSVRIASPRITPISNTTQWEQINFPFAWTVTRKEMTIRFIRTLNNNRSSSLLMLKTQRPQNDGFIVIYMTGLQVD